MGVKGTKVASIVLICLMLVLVTYGFSALLATALNTQLPETDCRADAAQSQALAYRQHYIPLGDPIDDPIPNKIHS